MRITLWLLAAAVALAQTPAKKMEFEVASIRAAQQDGDHDSASDGNLFRTHNLTLKRMIAMAYDVDVRQIAGGPEWIDSASYDINAKIPAEYSSHTREDIGRMLASLLADRFRLATHRETTQISGYALTVAKNGPKMELAAPGKANSHTHESKGHLTAENVSMEQFAQRLSRNAQVDKLVMDRTGLAGRYNFELEWDVADPLGGDAASTDRPSIFTALQEHLGLKLDPAKIQVESIVVDHAEKPGAN